MALGIPAQTVSREGMQALVTDSPPVHTVQGWQVLSDGRPYVPWQQFCDTAHSQTNFLTRKTKEK